MKRKSKIPKVHTPMEAINLVRTTPLPFEFEIPDGRKSRDFRNYIQKVLRLHGINVLMSDSNRSDKECLYVHL